MTVNTSMTSSSGTADWLGVRTAAAKTHDAIWQARRDAVPCRWYEGEGAEPVAILFTMVGAIFLVHEFTNLAHGFTSSDGLCFFEAGFVGLMLLMAFPFSLITDAVTARKNALAQSYWSPLTDTELEAVASLPLSSKTPGWDGWMAAAADHRLGLADLKAVVAAIDAQQADERQRQVLRHQNQIVFRDQETRESTA